MVNWGNQANKWQTTNSGKRWQRETMNSRNKERWGTTNGGDDKQCGQQTAMTTSRSDNKWQQWWMAVMTMAMMTNGNDDKPQRQWTAMTTNGNDDNEWQQQRTAMMMNGSDNEWQWWQWMAVMTSCSNDKRQQQPTGPPPSLQMWEGGAISFHFHFNFFILYVATLHRCEQLLTGYLCIYFILYT